MSGPPITLLNEELGALTRSLIATGMPHPLLAAIVEKCAGTGEARDALDFMQSGFLHPTHTVKPAELLRQFIAAREKAYRDSRFCHISITFSVEDWELGRDWREWSDVGGSSCDGDDILDTAKSVFDHQNDYTAKHPNRKRMMMMVIVSPRDGTMWTWRREA